jgi:hypothetical protein
VIRAAERFCALDAAAKFVLVALANMMLGCAAGIPVHLNTVLRHVPVAEREFDLRLPGGLRLVEPWPVRGTESAVSGVRFGPYKALRVERQGLFPGTGSLRFTLASGGAKATVDCGPSESTCVLRTAGEEYRLVLPSLATDTEGKLEGPSLRFGVRMARSTGRVPVGAIVGYVITDSVDGRPIAAAQILGPPRVWMTAGLAEPTASVAGAAAAVVFLANRRIDSAPHPPRRFAN